jgi:peptide-methionine (R)-S-oxide reductase
MNDLTRRGFIFGTSTIVSYGLLAGIQRLCFSALADDSADDPSSAVVTVVEFADDGTRIGKKTVAKVRRTNEEWKKLLTAAQFQVTRRAATEFAYSGSLYDQHAAGLYRCADCGNALFDSSTKFDSGTGWPSFWKPIAPENVREKTDTSYGVIRKEVKCTLCDAHLGHVFTDGPEPTGLRYCMNSVALHFLRRTT